MTTSPGGAGPDPADEDPTTRAPYSKFGTPAPLAVAAGLVFIEGLLTVLYGVAELFHLQSDRVTMGLSTSAFLLIYGGGLMFCAWGLNRVRSWARGPSLLAQLIWLGLAWSFRGGDTTAISVMLAIPAVIVLAGMLHPRSIEALNDED